MQLVLSILAKVLLSSYFTHTCYFNNYIPNCAEILEYTYIQIRIYPNNSAVHVKLHYNCPTTKYATVTVEMQGMCQNKCGL